ncbi:MAG: DUF192 domain-containing protein [Bryobacteraceae bacterium]
MRLFLPSFVGCLFLLAGCGGDPDVVQEFGVRTVTLPGGDRIVAEVMTRPEDMARGMMFRDSLPRDRGMLFIHPTPGRHRYWMYQVKVPLDIIWLDANRRIVEISAATPPCDKSKASECPLYGGGADARYVLELAGGEAARRGVQTGQLLNF